MTVHLSDGSLSGGSGQPEESRRNRRGDLLSLCRATGLWLLFFSIYVASAGTRTGNLEGQGHYVMLATWMLEGRVSDTTRPNLEDVVEKDGRYYIAFPVLPAILLMPLVAVGGTAANPVLFTAGLGALNVVLVRRLLRLGLPHLGVQPSHGLIRESIVAFALGTTHWYSAAAGTVWYTSQVCGLLFLLLAVCEALEQGRLGRCGVFLGLAMLARPPLAFAFPFFIHFVICGNLRRTVVRGLWIATPMAGFVAVMLIYNFMRFGIPTDFGYAQMDVGPVLKPFLEEGLFRFQHLPRNAYFAFLHPPRPMSDFPFFRFDPMGNGLGYVSPFLVGALLRRPSNRLGWATAAAGGAILFVDLCYFSSGYAQFGYRYVLDAMPFLMLLATAGAERVPAAARRALIAISVCLNFLGMLWILNWTRMWSQINAM